MGAHGGTSGACQLSPVTQTQVLGGIDVQGLHGLADVGTVHADITYLLDL